MSGKYFESAEDNAIGVSAATCFSTGFTQLNPPGEAPHCQE